MIMKKTVFVLLMTIATGVTINAQETTPITKKNSWLKLGANAGVPLGNAADVSSAVVGLDFKAQLMETNHVGIGLTTGYNHFFAKDNFKDFGTVPLGAFIRVYPQSKGFFAGLDAGYSFVTNIKSADGGLYVKPQLGYHNYDWNFFGFYNGIFRSNADGGTIPSAGIGASYNIRFN